MNKDNFAKREFSGVVIKRFIDYPNHGAPTIFFLNQKKDVICLELFSKIDISDSVVKVKGQLIVYIYKKDKRLVLFDYMNESEDFNTNPDGSEMTK